MRKSDYISSLFQTLLTCIREEVKTNQNSPSEVEERHQFYRDFQQTNKLRSCKIEAIEIVPGTTFSRSYALYLIKVVTSDIEYLIKKRFSDFQKIYFQHKQELHQKIGFPPKTFLIPGWVQTTTHKRKTWFNDIIQEILISQKEELKFSFYQFLQLYQHYQEEGITQYCRVTSKESEAILTDEELIQKIIILSHQPINSLLILQQIRGTLFDRKKRVCYEVARQILLGSGDEDGLLSVILTSSNPLLVSEGLQLLLEFFSPETNRDYEMFLRVLSRCPSPHLQLQYIDLEESDSILRSSYFQLLDCYGSVRSETAVKAVFDTFEKGDMLYHEYLVWKRLRSLENMN